MIPGFGTRLKVRREMEKMTQDEMARALGVTGNSYSHWENDLSEPSMECMVKIADFYHCSIDTLLEYDCDRRTEVGEPTTAELLMSLPKESKEILAKAFSRLYERRLLR